MKITHDENNIYLLQTISKAELKDVLASLKDEPVIPEPPIDPEPPVVEPEPPIQPEPTDPKLGELLWSANAETGDFSQWSGTTQMNQSNVLFFGTTEDVKRSGAKSFKLQVDAGGKMASAQMWLWSRSGPQNLDDVIYTVYYYVNEKVDFNGINWSNLFQWKARPESGGGDPILTIGLGVIGGIGSGGDNFFRLRNTREHWENAPSFNYDPIKHVAIKTKEWQKLQVRLIKGSNKDGRIIVWHNEELIYDIQNLTTYPLVTNDGRKTIQLNWSVNNYTQNTIPAITTIYVDDCSIHLPA